MGEELLRDPTNETLGVFRVFRFFFFFFFCVVCGLRFFGLGFGGLGFRGWDSRFRIYCSGFKKPENPLGLRV